MGVNMKHISRIFLGLAAIPAVQAGNGAWTSAGPDGGTIYETRADPNVPTTRYVTSRGGFFKSDDGGITWAPSNNGLVDVTNNPLVIDADAPGHLYVFDFGNRLYRSIDFGDTWIPTGFVLPPDKYPWFAADIPGEVGSFYVTTTVTTIAPIAAPMLLRTTDSGQTFSVPGTGLPLAPFYGIAVEPGNGQHVLAGTDCADSYPFGLYRSVDGGATWTGVGPAGACYSTNVSFGAGANPMRTLYAAIDGQLHRSDNSGATWTTLPHEAEHVFAHPNDPLTVYFTGGFANAGLNKSVDGGNVATPLSTGLSSNLTYTDTLARPVPIDPFQISADLNFPAPGAALWLSTEGDGLFRSGDGGTSWAPSQIGLRATNIRALAIHPNILAVNPGTGAGRNVYAGFGDTFFSSPGMFRSVDGGNSWNPLNSGLRASLLRTIVIDPTTAGVGSGGPPPALNAATMYATGRSSLTGSPERYRNAAIFKSVNSGLSWTLIDSGLPRTGIAPNDYSDLGTVRALALDPRSCTTPPVSGPCTSGPLQTIMAVADGTRITTVDTTSVPGTRRTITTMSHQVIRSTNAGSTWTARDGAGTGFPISATIRTCPASPTPPNNCLPGPSTTESSSLVRPAPLVVSPTTSGVAYVGTYIQTMPSGTLPPPEPVTGVYRTLDGGATWTAVNTGLPLRAGSSSIRHDVLALAIHPTNDQIVWATTVDFTTPNSSTIYKTINGGTTWTESGEGLRGKADIRALTLDPSDLSGNILYASGAGTPANPGAVYKSEDGGATWLSISVGLPADSALSIAVDPFNFNVIHAGTNTGVWSLTQVPDDDGDGIPDGTENNAPNGGDGNGDGQLDGAQRDVGSSVVIIRTPEGAGGFVTTDVITAASTPSVPGGCEQAVDVQTQAAALFGRDYLADSVRFYKYPRDLVRFEVLECSHGVIDVTYHNASFSTEYGWSFRFFGPATPGDDDSLRWREFSTRAQRVVGSVNKWRLTLDANQFGSYRPVNDSILFVGGPACNDDRLFRDNLEGIPETGPPTCDH
jgi:photosystem II stability/assembly factor-like uncharacterized protein